MKGPDARVIPRIVFYGAIGLATIVLFAVELVILWRAGFLRAHPDLSRGLLNALGVLTFFACYGLTDAILKHLGLSRSGTLVEQRTRSPLAPDAEGGDDLIFEIHPSCDQIILRWFLTAVTIAFLIFLLALLVEPRRNLQGITALLAMIALMGTIVLFLWATRGPIRADAHGITSPSRVMVPWEKIVTCEIRTTYDPFGTPRQIFPILKGKRGEILLVLPLNPKDQADCDRLLRFIRSRLPKLAVDEIDDTL